MVHHEVRKSRDAGARRGGGPTATRFLIRCSWPAFQGDTYFTSTLTRIQGWIQH
jgi:hypothetical protein